MGMNGGAPRTTKMTPKNGPPADGAAVGNHVDEGGDASGNGGGADVKMKTAATMVQFKIKVRVSPCRQSSPDYVIVDRPTNHIYVFRTF